MKGNDNSGFAGTSEEENRDVNVADDLESRIHTISKEESEDRKLPDVEKLDAFSRVVVSVRSNIWLFCKRHKSALRNLLYVGLHVVLIAYFAAVAVTYYKEGQVVDFWKGFGLLIVIYSLLYGCLLYYFVLKKFCGHPFRKIVQKPVAKIGRFFTGNKLCRFVLYLLPIVLLLAYLFLTPGSNRRFISLLGIVVFIAIGYVFSASPGHVNWRPVYSGLILQFLFALFALKWEAGRSVLQVIGDGASNFLGFTEAGSKFIYGPLVGDEFVSKYSPVFAFSVLPTIFFFAFFVNILSYYNILQWCILKFSWFVQLVMGTTACESVNAAASVFLGMTETLFLYKNHLKVLTRSELHAIMCAGWATVSGSVLAAFISFDISASHLITASLISAPAALSYSKLFYPEQEESKTTTQNIVLTREEGSNVLDAASRGAVSAATVVSCIIANIVAILAFTAFLDSLIQWLGLLLNYPDLSMQLILTKLCLPISFLMGVDPESIEDVALLFGTKTFVNEFRAYEMMRKLKHKFSARTEAIATYALCGFSNFGSIGITLGGIAALEPSLVPSAGRLAARAFIAANIVCCITACVAGTLLDVSG